MAQIAHLPGRAVLSLTGTDRIAFLNGLVSNDVALAAPGRAVWAALLTPQGKWLADFFIFSAGDRLLLDCEAARAPMIAQRLARFRLRSDVQIAAEALAVHAVWHGDIPLPGIAAPDPRLPDAGWRWLADAPSPTDPATGYDHHRMTLGLPDGSRDLESEKTILLEAGFDELNGISWTKGCYMGQELTARTRYRGLLKRRLFPVRATAPTPPPGTPVTAAGREVGTLRSGAGNQALALLRLDALDLKLEAAGTPLTVHIPAWAKLPLPA